MTMENGASLDAALSDVFSSGRDRGGNSAPPEVEAAPIPAPVAEEAAPPAVEPPKTDPDEQSEANNGRTVPLNELTGERKKYKALLAEEARLRAEADAERKILREQLERFMRAPQHQAAPVQQRQPVQAPDPWQDPEGAIRHAVSEVQEQTLIRELNKSEYRAKREHGVEVVEAAKQTAMQLGIITKFRDAPEPYDELVQWHKRYKAMQEVGNDLPSFKQNLEKAAREDERAKLLEELRTGKLNPAAPGAQAQPAPQVFPGTLAAATQQGPTGQITKNLEAATGDVFASDRKARGMRR